MISLFYPNPDLDRTSESWILCEMLRAVVYVVRDVMLSDQRDESERVNLLDPYASLAQAAWTYVIERDKLDFLDSLEVIGGISYDELSSCHGGCCAHD
jgi:hypothetical protein